MNEEFVNMFIEVMNKKIDDLTKNELMLQTRLNITTKLVEALQRENQELQLNMDKLQTNLNKKTAKKEENTF